MPTNSSKKHNYLKYGYLLLGLLVFFVLRYYYRNDPEVASGEGIFPRCIFNLATGFHCPGCGSQRATHDLLHFRIGEALKHNIVIVLIAISILSKIYAFFSKKYFPKYYYNLPHKSYFIYTSIGIVCIYWILRNIPYEPFTYLAP
ncbi:DUF2752 domain-containing protein [uncultured Dokdonia sp.]|uniref:DUF2752 domain-containing protein n=1 Tax=uncultured Dokdonia sp. TaxID=575653 RepID=UPI0026078B12|nr:DUF2752 domain-containing protein [uncultured Dokdonia sp.]